MPIISRNRMIAQNPFYSLGGEHEKNVRVSKYAGGCRTGS
jgi:hypothetical protein